MNGVCLDTCHIHCPRYCPLNCCSPVLLVWCSFYWPCWLLFCCGHCEKNIQCGSVHHPNPFCDWKGEFNVCDKCWGKVSKEVKLKILYGKLD